MGDFFPILVVIWILSIPGILVGIILTAVGPKTRKAGLTLLITSFCVLIIGGGICYSLLRGLTFH
jgi:hypothetical protein